MINVMINVIMENIDNFSHLECYLSSNADADRDIQQ